MTGQLDSQSLRFSTKFFNLTIGAIFQNEARFLKEWIDFHIKIGVEYFYLFDHLSTDEPEKILEAYKDKVHLTRWPLSCTNVYDWTEVQCLAYERAIHWAKSHAKWMALLDVDEFLFSPNHTLSDVLKEFEPFGGVCVNWQVYGTSNVERIPDHQTMRETLILKAPQNHTTNRYIKSIVRPETVYELDNPHSAKYKEGFFQVNTKKERFEGALSPSVEVDLLRINHYTFRDEEYLKTAKLPRLQKWWGVSEEELKARAFLMNEIEDITILKSI